MLDWASDINMPLHISILERATLLVILIVNLSTLSHFITLPEVHASEHRDILKNKKAQVKLRLSVWPSACLA